MSAAGCMLRGWHGLAAAAAAGLLAVGAVTKAALAWPVMGYMPELGPCATQLELTGWLCGCVLCREAARLAELNKPKPVPIKVRRGRVVRHWQLFVLAQCKLAHNLRPV